MPTFAELMSYSKAQTSKTENLAAELLAKRKEEEARRAKQQADQEKRERDMQEKIRKRHFEELQKQEQRKRDAERVRERREAEAKRREDEARDKLVKGRIPGQGAPRSRHSNRDGGDGGSGKRSLADEGDAAVGLTRQEKRERRLQADLNRTYGNMSGRSKTTGGYVRSGRKLPGGAVDRLSGGGGSDSAAARSARERLAQMPNELRMLNTVKRDTRTIDEILQDRARAKSGQVIEGDRAKEFNDWFTPAKHSKDSPAPSKATSAPPKSGKMLPPSSKPLASKASLPSFSKTSSSKPSKASAPPAKSAKKRPREATPPEDDGLFTDEEEYDDYDDLPPPPSAKRRATDGGGSSLGDTIWSLFGKSRSNYVARDVLSDDEDMEADSRALEAEERRSARVAKQEDLEALAEERRHEEEKRRRRKMGRA